MFRVKHVCNRCGHEVITHPQMKHFAINLFMEFRGHPCSECSDGVLCIIRIESLELPADTREALNGYRVGLLAPVSDREGL